MEAGYWLVVILGFGFLIFAHEMGHFLACKLVGVRVIRFALGFGPRLFGKKIGETDYCICAIPCGGYVKMAGGEGETDETATGAPDEFPQKTPGQRALVVASGPIFSVAIALPLLFAAFIGGLERPSSRINQIVPGLPAWNTGMKRGDVITGIKQAGEDSWTPIRLWREVKLNQILGDKVGDIVIRVDRDGEEKQFQATTSADDAYAIGLNPAIAGKGMGKQMGYVGTLVGYVPDESGFAKAGITSGSKLRSINGKAVFTWNDVEFVLQDLPGQSVEVAFEDPDGKPRTAAMVVDSEKYWWLGIETERTNVVGRVRPDFPADKAGLTPGDRITAIGDQPVRNWLDLHQQVLTAAESTVQMTVETGGESRVVQVTLEKGEALGDVLGITEDAPLVVGFAEGSDAKTAGVAIGDKLLRFFCRNPAEANNDESANDMSEDPYGGRKFTRWPPVPQLRFGGDSPENAPEPFNILVERRGERHVVKVTPTFGEWGVPGASARLDTCRVVPPGDVMGAVAQGFKETVHWIGLAGRTLWMLVAGKLSGDMVSGPVGIFTVSRSQAEVGLLTFLEFMVIITVHLGVINLVPFPVLDGGHLVFLLVEKVRGKPINEVVMGRILYAGMLTLIGLMLFVTWNDLSKFF